jgi:hypothetical protein
VEFPWQPYLGHHEGGAEGHLQPGSGLLLSFLNRNVYLAIRPWNLMAVAAFCGVFLSLIQMPCTHTELLQQLKEALVYQISYIKHCIVPMHSSILC